MTLLQIPQTIDVICACWESAEKDLRSKIESQFPDAPEEFITQEFHGLLKQALEDAGRERRIEQAFLSDLGDAFPYPEYGDALWRVASGLVAEVVLHHRGTETRTGGDFGLVIDRPQITSDGTMLHNTPSQHGLLCQAKLRDRHGKWRNLKLAQRRHLPKALQYFGLILYEYTDKERYRLRPFRWQLGRSAKRIDDVVQWLQRGKFPSPRRSTNIITRLGNGRIGTDDERLIREIVAPPSNTTLHINITWEDGVGPGSTIMIYTRAIDTMFTRSEEREAVSVKVLEGH